MIIPTNTKSMVFPSPKIYINDSLDIDAHVQTIDKNEDGNDIAIIHYPMLRYREIKHRKNDTVKIVIDNQCIYSGLLYDYSSTLENGLTWTVKNNLDSLDWTVINRTWNKNNNFNNGVVDWDNLIGMTVRDMLIDIIQQSNPNIEYDSDTFPQDFIGEYACFSERPTSVIASLLERCSGNYGIRMDYLINGRQKFIIYRKGGSGYSNKIIKINHPVFGRSYKNGQGGISNINEASFSSENDLSIKQLVGYGGNKLFELTVKLIPSWSETEENYIKNNPKLLLDLSSNNPYGHVYKKWLLPLWSVKNSSSNTRQSDWTSISVYPKVIDSLSYSPGKSFLWIEFPSNIKGALGYVEMPVNTGTKQLSWIDSGYKICTDSNGENSYIEIDNKYCAGLTRDKEVWLTARFELPECLYCETPNSLNGRLDILKDDIYQLISSDITKLSNSQSSYVLSGCVLPTQTNETISGKIYTVNGYHVENGTIKDDSILFYNNLLNRLDSIKNNPVNCGESLEVSFPIMNFSINVGDYYPEIMGNVTSIKHDFNSLTTSVSISSGS